MKPTLWRAKPDPPVKSNGRCVVCDEERPPVAVKQYDPFCSASCAKRWHKVSDAPS